MRALIVLLCFQLALPRAFGANPEPLQVKIIRGQDGVNRIQDKYAVQPEVEVTDGQGQPVAGAQVTFQLPAAGPGASFQGWMRSVSLSTGPDGRAAAMGLEPNNEAGPFRIKVTAMSGEQVGSALITQTNTVSASPVKSRKRTLFYVAAGAAATAILVGVVASRSGSNAAAPTVSVSPGPVTIGGPR